MCPHPYRGTAMRLSIVAGRGYEPEAALAVA